MKNPKAVVFVIFAVIVVLCGCNVNVPQEIVPDTFKSPTQKTKAPDPVVDSNVKRFSKKVGDNASYDDVRVWSERFNELKKQNKQLKTRNDELTADNKRLMARFNVMKDNLGTAEKELKEANLMLIETTKDLEGWKANVLSFREEQNYVHKEQLKALIKILKLLGAEYEDPEDAITAAE